MPVNWPSVGSAVSQLISALTTNLEVLGLIRAQGSRKRCPNTPLLQVEMKAFLHFSLIIHGCVCVCVCVCKGGGADILVGVCD